ncbi:hypothetical protein BJY01DRAFT_252947 [Aspergillus pseudoustus]|uniref:Uncharacterized protein n=1 Tax=Aspergillus pseudoustus TaxID=1810923 RepID=A0ABR4J453_9EURO
MRFSSSSFIATALTLSSLALGQDVIPEASGIITVHLHSSRWDSRPSCTTLRSDGCLDPRGYWDEDSENCATFFSDEAGNISIPGTDPESRLQVETQGEDYVLRASAERSSLIQLWTTVGNAEATPPDLLLAQFPRDREHQAGPVWYLFTPSQLASSYGRPNLIDYSVGLCFRPS